MTENVFVSNYFLRILKGDFHPFTPNYIKMDDDHIEYSRRNWHLISVDSESLHFQNITGITVNKHLFGATLIVKSSGNDSIIVDGFWKSAANEIKKQCEQRIAAHTQRGSNEALKQIFNDNTKAASYSAADEIIKCKKLLDEGVITTEEFQQMKKRILG